MARRASVRYWKSRGGYCCWFRGKQELLAQGPDDFPSGPTYQVALKKFIELTLIGDVDQAKDHNTVRVICEMYMRWISTRRKPLTLKIRQRIFVPLTDALGEVEIGKLTQHMIYTWLDQMREWRTHPGTGNPTRWTDGSVRNACTSIQAAFNWAVKTGLITKNPLSGLTAYSYRHTFATAWLEQGRSVDILAELLGNSPAVIRKHYSHLLGDIANLRRQLEAFRNAAGETETPNPSGDEKA